MINQRERQFAPAVLGETVKHTLARECFAFRLEIAGRHRGPRCYVIEPVGSRTPAIGGEQHLDRRHLAGEAGKMAAELRQGGAVGNLEQRQQRLTDNPALIAHAAQQQLLAVPIC